MARVSCPVRPHWVVLFIVPVPGQAARLVIYNLSASNSDLNLDEMR